MTDTNSELREWAKIIYVVAHSKERRGRKIAVIEEMLAGWQESGAFTNPRSGYAKNIFCKNLARALEMQNYGACKPSVGQVVVIREHLERFLRERGAK